MMVTARVPGIVTNAGVRVVAQYTASFRRLPNANTRAAYCQAAARFFDWVAARGLSIAGLSASGVTAYFDGLRAVQSDSSMRVHASALRFILGRFAKAGIVESDIINVLQITAEKPPKKYKAVLTRDQVRKLIRTTDVMSLVGHRDRALLGVMVYTFAPPSVAAAINVGDYDRNRRVIELKATGSPSRTVPVHKMAARFLDQYLEAIGNPSATEPLFRTSIGRTGTLSENRMTRGDVLRMVKRRAAAANLPQDVCCRSLRRAGISAYLANGGTVGIAKVITGNSVSTIVRYEPKDIVPTRRDIHRIAI